MLWTAFGLISDVCVHISDTGGHAHDHWGGEVPARHRPILRAGGGEEEDLAGVRLKRRFVFVLCSFVLLQSYRET